MLKFKLLLSAFLVMVAFAGCASEETTVSNKLEVAVAIGPMEEWVNAVGGDLVHVFSMVPPGASPESYQPSPKEMVDFESSEVFFGLDVPMEINYLLPHIEDNNLDIEVVDLADVAEEVYGVRMFEEDEEHEHEDEADHEDGDHEEGEEGHNHEGRDPHIWMSPARVMLMVEAIGQSLAQLDSENADLYINNAEAYVQKLKDLDEDIHTILEPHAGQVFIIMHPSMGYFADDYDLDMVAIEEDGKEAGVQHLQEVIDLANEEGRSVVFYQAEFDSSQAETIASQIGGSAVMIAPLSTDYIANMEVIKEAFAKSFEE